MNTHVCPSCFGQGWVEISVSEHGCDGTDEMCARVCPVEGRGQAECEMCEGTGSVWILPAPAQPEPEKQPATVTDNDLPF